MKFSTLLFSGLVALSFSMAAGLPGAERAAWANSAQKTPPVAEGARIRALLAELAPRFGEDATRMQAIVSGDGLSQARISGDGRSLELAWSRDAQVFVAELERRRALGEAVFDERFPDQGVRRVVSRPLAGEAGGRWRLLEFWMDLEGVLRLAVAAAPDEAQVMELAPLLRELRENGRFGAPPQLHGPSAAAPPAATCEDWMEAARRMADLHQYGGDLTEVLRDLEARGFPEEALSRFREMRAEILQAPRLLGPEERDFAIADLLERLRPRCPF